MQPLGVLVAQAHAAVGDVPAEGAVHHGHGALVVENRVEQVVAVELGPPVRRVPVPEGGASVLDSEGTGDGRGGGLANGAGHVGEWLPGVRRPVERHAVRGARVDDDQVVRGTVEGLCVVPVGLEAGTAGYPEAVPPVEVVPAAVDHRPGGRHRPAGVRPQVVPLRALLQPAGGHSPRAAQVVPGASVADPAGAHGTAGVRVVPGVAGLEPSGGHGSGFAQVVPGPRPYPRGRAHRAGGIEVVPGAVDLGPSGGHRAARVRVQVVPGAAGDLPAGDHGSGVG